MLFKADSVENFVFGCEICEDLWAVKSPSFDHALNGATVIANLSCSDETVGKADKRRQLVSSQSSRLVCGYVYSDAGDGESTTDTVFAGHDIIAENGKILAESKLFDNQLTVSEIDLNYITFERSKHFNYSFSIDEGYKTVSFHLEKSKTELTRKFKKTPFVPTNE
ncbi:MAG: NAD(+) synthase, partial [Clostridia bacterium]|nr:NAD(+) synthase [Clostridia bacterium]